MNNKSILIGALLLSTFGTAMSAEPLPGSEWSPIELRGAAFEPIGDSFVRFENDGRFFGNAGCNTMRGQFVTNGDAILFGPAATTMMACPEDIANQEFKFLTALNAARGFERDKTALSLTDEAGDVILKFVQRDAD